MSATKPIQTESSRLDWLPYAGIGIGTITGIASRFVSQTGFFSKNPTMCNVARSGFFSAINSWKQLEIKYCALLTPLFPLALQIGSDTVKDKSGKRICARVVTAVKKNFTLEQGIYFGAFAALGLTGTSYGRALGICSKNGFDASGHMMLKTLCATLLSQVATAIAKKENRTWRHAFNALYAATDAVLLHHTVSSCHTIPEVIGGLGWGLTILGGVKLAIKKLETYQKPEAPDILEKLQRRSCRHPPGKSCARPFHVH